MTAPARECQPDNADAALLLALRAGSKLESGNNRPSRIAMKAAADRLEELSHAYDQMNDVFIATSDRVEELTKALEAVKGMFGPSKCFSGCKCWRCQMNFTIDRALAPSLETRGDAT